MLSNLQSLLLIPIVVFVVFSSTSITPSYGLYPDPKEIKSHVKSIKENIDDLVNSQVHVIVSNLLNKVVEFEILHENRTVISQPIPQGATLYDRVSPGDSYILVITPEGEKPFKERINLETCVAIVVKEGPIPNDVEVRFAQCRLG
ncbi:MAG: hypothetical protein L0H55_16885 [Candidatus Nitrosocosmicus sp.]|nr:hypothetical protein [Candidatus Nitrosocosmicus sp.]